jgi:hypothetical protein
MGAVCKDVDAYGNDAGEAVEVAEEQQLMTEWRSNGPLGVLLAVVNYIKTPQQ